jgi:hypothetical protein
MTNNDPEKNEDLTAAMIATNERRLAELRATPPIIMPDRKARRDIRRNRRHSVRHRSIR